MGDEALSFQSISTSFIEGDRKTKAGTLNLKKQNTPNEWMNTKHGTLDRNVKAVLSDDNKISQSPNMQNHLTKSASDKHQETSKHAKGEAKTRSKTLSTIFTKKKVESPKPELSKKKFSKKEIKSIFLENAELQENVLKLKRDIKHKDIEIDLLSDKSKHLQWNLEALNEQVDKCKKIERERNSLTQLLEKAQNDSEHLETEIAFLQEERDEMERDLHKLSAEYQQLQSEYDTAYKSRDVYKRNCVRLQGRIEQVVHSVCSDMCDLVEQNRFLMGFNFRGDPQRILSTLKTTEDYLRLQSEHKRLIQHVEKQNTRLVTQEVYISDLKVEIASVVDQLMKAGIAYECKIPDGPEYYLDVIRKEGNKGIEPVKCVTSQPNDTDESQPDQTGQGGGGGAANEKVDPTKLRGMALLNHMKKEMNEKILAPSEQMVKKGLESVGQSKAVQSVKPLAGVATGQSPTQAAAKSCCDRVCSPLKNCLPGKKS